MLRKRRVLFLQDTLCFVELLGLIMKKFVFPIIAILIFFAFWEVSAHHYQTQILILPAPSAIFLRIISHFDRFLYHAQVTFFEMIAGFLLAFFVSFPFGFFMSAKKNARMVLQPIFVFIQCVPMFALAPIMVIWFGWSYVSIIVPTALMIFFPLTMNIYQGLRSTPQEMIDYFRVNQATNSQIFYKLQLPFALPQIFAGFKIAAATAGIGACAGEFAGAKSGLGILMLESRRATDLETTFAALFCLTFMSMAFYLFILMMEKMMIKKRPLPKKIMCLLIMALTLTLTGCSKEEQVADATKETRLLLDWLPNPNHIPLYAGVEKGIFKKHGINLIIQKIPDPSDAIPYVVAKKADLALFYMPDTLRAIEGGNPLKPIGILFKQPLNAIIYRDGEGIADPSDLNGKTIGYCVDGSSTTVLDYILEKNHIVPSEKQNVTFDLVTTLCGKHVDAIYGAYWNIECEHMRSLGQNTDHFDLLSLGYPNYYELIVVSRSDSYIENSEFESNFQKALQESINYSKAHVAEAFDIYISQNPDKSRKTVAWEKESWNRTYPLLTKDQTFEPQVTENLRNWLKMNQLIN